MALQSVSTFRGKTDAFGATSAIDRTLVKWPPIIGMGKLLFCQIIEKTFKVTPWIHFFCNVFIAWGTIFNIG